VQGPAGSVRLGRLKSALVGSSAGHGRPSFGQPPVVAPRFHGPPDPKDFDVIDCGQTIRLGDYEAAYDAILYVFDPEFRQRLKELRVKEEQSFGASLRRLRLLKGMRRSDFHEVNEKTLARIERGEVKLPHKKTLDSLARQLGVESGDIASC